MEKKYYRCELCGNIADMMVSSGVVPVCCNQPMELLKANTKDAAQEKHVPACTLSGNTLTVQIGEVVHPMEEEHYIQWIAVVQGKMSQTVMLAPGEVPKASFIIDPKQAFEVFEFCNLHGLWKA